MLERKNGDKVLLVLGVLFTVIALVAIIALARLKSKALDTANQQVGTGNTAPTTDSTVISNSSYGGAYDPIITQEATTKTVYVHGAVSDSNGCTDLTGVYVVLYRSGVGFDCAPNDNNCYIASSSTFANCTGGADTSADYQVSFDLKNYVDPTDTGSPYAAQNWYASTSVFDVAVAEGDLQGAATEMQSLGAFNLYVGSVQNGTLDYGTLALGATSAEKTLTFDNTGNRAVSSTVVADADMTSNLSGFDDILSTQVHYASTTGFAWTLGYGITAISKTTPSAFDIELSKQTTDASSTIPGYFRLKMPASGVNGTYTNVLTLTAVATP